MLSPVAAHTDSVPLPEAAASHLGDLLCTPPIYTIYLRLGYGMTRDVFFDFTLDTSICHVCFGNHGRFRTTLWFLLHEKFSKTPRQGNKKWHIVMSTLLGLTSSGWGINRLLRGQSKIPGRGHSHLSMSQANVFDCLSYGNVCSVTFVLTAADTGKYRQQRDEISTPDDQ